MDSLLASYASSSDEDNEEKSSSELVTNKASFSRPSLSSSLPQPQALFANPNPDLNEPTKGSILSTLPATKSKNWTNPLGFDPNPNRSTISKSLISPSVRRSSDFDQEDGSYEEIEGKTSKGSMFSSLRAPKSNNSTNLLDLESIFDGTNDFPQERTELHNQNEKKPPRGFISSSIPAPKSKESTNPLGLDLNLKKIVRFTPPINPNFHKNTDDKDEEEEEREKKKPIIDPLFNASSTISSMLPAPKNSLCLAPQSNSSNFSSRKSSLSTQIEELTQYESYPTNDNLVPAQTGYETMASYTESGALETSSSGYPMDYGSVENYGGFEGYNWNNNESFNNNNTMINDFGRAKGKRGRNEMPAEILEVKQDELMKNRPKQDPRKLTGLAFGPSYQPAPSEKGKPSKLHKRKHQIGTLYHDMKSKEMELAERRAKGFLTKAETQAKYGW